MQEYMHHRGTDRLLRNMERGCANLRKTIGEMEAAAYSRGWEDRGDAFREAAEESGGIVPQYHPVWKNPDNGERPSSGLACTERGAGR